MIRRDRVLVAVVVAIVAVATVVVIAVTLFSGAALPVAITRHTSKSYVVHGAVRALLVIVVVLVAAATIGFARRARVAPEPMNRALALGGVVATFSWIEFVGRPSVY